MKRLVCSLAALLAGVLFVLGQACPKGVSAPVHVLNKQVRARILDAGGQVFNVKAYGAKGNGVTDDTRAVNSAISAAQVKGGMVLFPPGVYELRNPNPVNPRNLLNGHRVVSIRCVSPASTTIQFTGSAGFLLSDVLRTAPYYAGDVKDCNFDLTKASSGTIALRAIDSAGWFIANNGFIGTAGNDDVGIEFENSAAWSERNQVMSNQFYELVTGVKFLQDSGDSYNSFGYNMLSLNHFQIPASSDGILVTGSGILYSAEIFARANFDSTSGNVVHTSNGATISFTYVNAHGEGAAGTAVVCADSGTTWTSDYGMLIPDTSSSVECSGGATIGFSGFGNTTLLAARSLILGATAQTNGAGFNGTAWTVGSGAPSGPCGNGSMYSNTSGSSGSTLYVCVSGSWVDVK